MPSIGRGRGRGARGRGAKARSASRTYRAPTPGARNCGRCAKRHPPRKCPAYNQICKRCNIKGHFQQCCKTRTQVDPTKLGDQEGNNLRSAGGLRNNLVTIQGLTMSSVRTPIHFMFNRGPKASRSNNIMFDEIANTQVLGDVKLANRAGTQLSQRFKLDSGACANLLPIGIYSKLFSKQDRDLKGSIDPRISLIAANNNSIKTTWYCET